MKLDYVSQQKRFMLNRARFYLPVRMHDALAFGGVLQNVGASELREPLVNLNSLLNYSLVLVNNNNNNNNKSNNNLLRCSHNNTGHYLFNLPKIS